MKKRTIWVGGLAVLLLCGLFSVPAGAQKAKNVNLRAIFRDATGDKIRSDGKGTYTNGANGVKCYISSNGDLTFDVSSTKDRCVVVELTEAQRSANPFDPLDPTIYPTDYASGPTGVFSFCTHQFYPRYPLNLLEMAPNSTAWGAILIQSRPGNNGPKQVYRFIDPEWTGDMNKLKNPNNTGCVLLVTARDTNGDGQNDSWDLEPIPAITPPLYEYSNVAWIYRQDWDIFTYFGWFYVPFEITFQRLK
jgi:hypothetical protein